MLWRVHEGQQLLGKVSDAAARRGDMGTTASATLGGCLQLERPLTVVALCRVNHRVHGVLPFPVTEVPSMRATLLPKAAGAYRENA